MSIQKDDFVHLHVHSDRGSLLDGMVQIDKYAKHVKSIGQSHATVTDHGSLGAIFNFVNHARKNDIKPICGIEAYTTLKERQESGPEDDGSRNYHLILLAQNQEGLNNIIKMNSIAYLEGSWYKPRMDYALLREYSDNVIASTACLGSVTSQLIGRGEKAEAKRRIQILAEIFPGRLFVELQAHGCGASGSFQKQVNEAMIEFANELNLPLVMTGDSHYQLPTHKNVHNQLLAMQTGGKMWMPTNAELDSADTGGDGRTRFEFETTPLLDTISMLKLAQEWNIPREAITNTKYLAELIDSDSYFQKSVNRYPVYEGVPDGMTAYDEIVRLAKAGLTLRMGGKPPKEYRDRLMRELKQLKIMGMCDYMLIMKEWLDACKDKGIHTGPGRGCLAEDAMVMTERGFVKLPEVTVTDKVLTRDGKYHEVTCTHQYPLRNEELYRITSAFGTSLQDSPTGVALTHDHKVFAAPSKAVSNRNPANCEWKNITKPTESEAAWMPASRLKVGDWIWVPASKEVRWPARSTDVATHARNLVDDGLMKKYSMSFFPADCWNSPYLVTAYKNASNQHECMQHIPLDNETAWVMGKWLADGWIRRTKKTIGICYNPQLEQAQGDRILNWLRRIGANKYTIQKDFQGSTCIDIDISNYFVSALFIDIFGCVNSHTKHIPDSIFQHFGNEQLRSFLQGYCDGDGHRPSKTLYSMKTVSRKLAFDIKKLVTTIGYPCAITEESSGAFQMRMPSEILDPQTPDYSRNWVKTENGHFVRITSIELEHHHKYVYDISVEEEPSYISDIGLVHNSAPGALPAYALGITHVDPIQYDLSFERFMALPRCGQPLLFESKMAEKIDNYLEKSND